MVERVLVVAAHPDDIDFAAAGSVARWISEGVNVTYCLVTDGAAGGSDASISRSEMATIRRGEQTDAAKQVGVTDLYWLGFPDGEVEPTLDLRRELTRVIRIFRPERVLCPSPERWWDRIQASHPDHMAAGEATVRAVYPDARNPFAHLSLSDLPAWTVQEIYLMADPKSDVFVDVTDTFPAKMAALRAHVSQGIPANENLEEWIRGWLTASAQQGGLPEGRLAEAFRRVATG
ncbi:MAG: PIG-L deacetylase family protein [Acidimicrobiales bacterium]